jgi:hypothetical protein
MFLETALNPQDVPLGNEGDFKGIVRTGGGHVKGLFPVVQAELVGNHPLGGK